MGKAERYRGLMEVLVVANHQVGSVPEMKMSARRQCSCKFTVVSSKYHNVVYRLHSRIGNPPLSCFLFPNFLSPRPSGLTGLGGVRKARLANPTSGKGKCGGYRYLYLYLETKQHIHLLVLLDKNEQEDASEEQRK
jgi:hypothetical protein